MSLWIGEDFELEPDKYGWMLHTYSDGKGRGANEGKVVRSKKTSYPTTLKQGLLAVQEKLFQRQLRDENIHKIGDLIQLMNRIEAKISEALKEQGAQIKDWAGPNLSMSVEPGGRKKSEPPKRHPLSADHRPGTALHGESPTAAEVIESHKPAEGGTLNVKLKKARKKIKGSGVKIVRKTK